MRATVRHTDGASVPFLNLLDGRRGWQAALLGGGFTFAVTVGWLALGYEQILREGAPALRVDFRVFWAAARLAWSGEPLAAFDVDRLTSLHQVAVDDWMPFLYPPGFLAAVTPFGALSFWPAWTLFTLLSLAAIALAARPHAGGCVPAWLCLALAPAYLPALTLGQTSLFWVAGLLAALAALRGDRLVLAGVFIGLLTLKPQLGLLIPVALLAARAWRVVAAATVTALALAAIPTLIYGFEYWETWAAAMQVHSEVVRDDIVQNGLMLSPYAALAGLGVPEHAALAVQWLVALAAAALVWWAWSSPRVGFDLRAAVLCCAIPLSSPYFWYYEAALLVPAALFLLRAGVLGAGNAGLAVAGVIWIGIAPAFILVLGSVAEELSLRYVVEPVVLVAASAAARGVWRAHRPVGPDDARRSAAAGPAA